MSDPSDDAPFRDAEAWLASQGVERDPLRVAPDPAGEAARAPVSPREAQRLATEAASVPPDRTADPAEPERPELQDQVSAAVAYARRSTAQAPKSEARLRDKLAGRDYPEIVIRLAMQRCRDEGIVDDEAYAKAFAEERRAKGHAPFRIRVDLSKRGFPDALIDRVLARFEAQDPEAQALELAVRKARSLGSVDAETAFRRTVGYVARRGYTEGVARKVAREAVFDAREHERTAGH